MDTMKRDREARYRTRLRAEVRAMLGNACARAAEGGCGGRLDVDHKNGRDWDPTKVDSRTRWRRYREEARRGEVRLLCQTHNRSDNGRDPPDFEDEPNIPF
jgi:hypothetical protein